MRPRGYTLPLVILVLGSLATAMTLMVLVLGANAKTTGQMLGRRETLYACDGVVRGLMVKSRDYFANTATPTAAGLRDHLCGAGTTPLCPPVNGWFPDFVVEQVTASTGTFDAVEEVPTGPFRGQMARRTDISLTVLAKKASSNQRCRVTQTGINSEIGLFQFAVFSAMPIESIQPATMDISGRVHVNGDFEAGGTNPLVIEKITAAGRILATSDGFSIRHAGTGNPVPINAGNDGDQSNWRVTSEASWAGNAQDVSWGVPFLRLPVATTAVVQAGRNSSGAVTSNIGMLRVLVDPPRSGDDQGTADERLANKAMIRIINGIWYKNDGSAWPGTPIWSDHPTTYTTTDTVEAATVATTKLAAAPPSSSGPRRYSYYETNTGTGLVANDAARPSIISYGLLQRAGAGSWAVGQLSGTSVIAAGNDSAALLRGTRSGFIDGRVAKNVTNGAASINTSLGRILPLNFDVAAFVDAFRPANDPATNLTEHNGELLGHFPNGLGRDAIVWIANTHSGWLNGFPNGAASKPPAQAGSEIPASSLPLPLCGGDSTSDLAAGVPRMACSSSGMNGATAVRIWNASAIDPAVFPHGLSIVSNGPVYVLGDTNTGSLTAAVPGVPRAESASGNWVPLMVGGDAVSLLSNNWADEGRRWGLTFGAAGFAEYGVSCGADAIQTTYAMAVVSGHVERTSVSSGGVHNFPRFLECWSGVEARIHGSLVAGYRSVYQDQGFSLGPYRPPVRNWKFDPNLAKPANQPPGTPSFFVSAVERWARD